MPLIKNEIRIDLVDFAKVLKDTERETAVYVLAILKEKLGSDYMIMNTIQEVCKRYGISPNFIP